MDMDVLLRAVLDPIEKRVAAAAEHSVESVQVEENVHSSRL